MWQSLAERPSIIVKNLIELLGIEFVTYICLPETSDYRNNLNLCNNFNRKWFRFIDL